MKFITPICQRLMLLLVVLIASSYLLFTSPAAALVKPVNSYSDFKQIVQSPQPVAVFFTAEWNGPSRTISPIFSKLSNDPQLAQVKFFQVDVDAQQQISQEVGIRALPAFIFFQNGNKINSLVGANPPALQQALLSLN